MLQLIFTSTPKGLIQGRSGFSTVAMTCGFPQNLIPIIENLSAYERLYAADDANAERNPVNYRFIRQRLGAQNYSICSKIEFSGPGYSRRGTPIASHVLFTQEELSHLPGSPAQILAATVNFAWSGQVEELPVGRQPQLGGSFSQGGDICKRLMGHGEWAQILAWKYKNQRNKPYFFEFDPLSVTSEEVLALIGEVSACLTPQEREEFTFSTYCHNSPQGNQAFIRVYPAGSPFLGSARFFSKEQILRLGTDVALPANYHDMMPASREAEPVVAVPVSMDIGGPAPVSSEADASVSAEAPMVQDGVECISSVERTPKEAGSVAANAVPEVPSPATDRSKTEPLSRAQQPTRLITGFSRPPEVKLPPPKIVIDTTRLEDRKATPVMKTSGMPIWVICLFSGLAGAIIVGILLLFFMPISGRGTHPSVPATGVTQVASTGELAPVEEPKPEPPQQAPQTQSKQKAAPQDKAGSAQTGKKPRALSIQEQMAEFSRNPSGKPPAGWLEYVKKDYGSVVLQGDKVYYCPSKAVTACMKAALIESIKVTVCGKKTVPFSQVAFKEEKNNIDIKLTREAINSYNASVGDYATRLKKYNEDMAPIKTKSQEIIQEILGIGDDDEKTKETKRYYDILVKIENGGPELDEKKQRYIERLAAKEKKLSDDSKKRRKIILKMLEKCPDYPEVPCVNEKTFEVIYDKYKDKFEKLKPIPEPEKIFTDLKLNPQVEITPKAAK